MPANCGGADSLQGTVIRRRYQSNACEIKLSSTFSFASREEGRKFVTDHNHILDASYI